MNEKKIFIIFIVFFMFFFNSVSAQEYKYEIGGMAGVSFYMGDANKTKLYQSPRGALGAVFRYNKNFRWAYKFDLAMGQVAGNTQKSGNVFPNGANKKFSRTFYELGGQIEYNFFNYSDKYEYLGTRKISPYIFTGFGLTMASGENFFVGTNLPIGVGVKYKYKERLNIGFEFSMRKLFGDSFDNPKKGDLDLNNPYNITSSILKNKDWYSLTMITVTWDFGVRTTPCVNDLY